MPRRGCRPARVRSRRISLSNSANIARMPAIARPAGVVRSSASVSDTKPTPRCSSSWSVASRSVTDRPQRSSRQTSTTSISRRRAAPAVFHELLAWPHRSRPHGRSRQWSSPAGQHTPAWLDSASEVSADRSWKRGHTSLPGTFSPVFVPGQKRYRILPSEGPVWRAFRSVTQAWPQSFLFGHAGYIIPRCAPMSRGSTRASIPRGWPPVPARAAVTRSDSRMSWRRTARRCGSDS